LKIARNIMSGRLFSPSPEQRRALSKSTPSSEALPGQNNTLGGGPPVRSDRGWLRFGNLKFEAMLFLLIAVTFAAVLGQEAITSKQLLVDPHDSHYYQYSYSDHNDGGKSEVTTDAADPLTWRCNLRPSGLSLYCGDGLSLGDDSKTKGLDLSKYSDIEIRLTYHGVGTHMKMILESAPPAALKARVGKDETMPMVTTFGVVQGENDIHLTAGEFKTEHWWTAKHGFATDDATSKLDDVKAFAFGSGDSTPAGSLAVKVQ